MTTEYRRSSAWQPITITTALKQRLKQDNDDRRLKLNSNRSLKVTALKNAEDEVKRLKSDLVLIDDQLKENLKEQLTIGRLSVGDYEVVSSDPFRPVSFGTDSFKATITTDRDFTYIAKSRSGGKRPHNVTWNDSSRKWDCACDGGVNRGYCWATLAVARGVHTDVPGFPYVIDNQGVRRNVARFRKDF